MMSTSFGRLEFSLKAVRIVIVVDQFLNRPLVASYFFKSLKISMNASWSISRESILELLYLLATVNK